MFFTLDIWLHATSKVLLTIDIYIYLLSLLKVLRIGLNRSWIRFMVLSVEKDKLWMQSDRILLESYQTWKSEMQAHIDRNLLSAPLSWDKLWAQGECISLRVEPSLNPLLLSKSLSIISIAFYLLFSFCNQQSSLIDYLATSVSNLKGSLFNIIPLEFNTWNTIHYLYYLVDNVHLDSKLQWFH